MNDDKLIAEVSATFPATFGLRGCPDCVFRILQRDSYVTNDGEVMLYTQIMDSEANNQWFDWSKGTPDELRRQIVEVT